MSPAAVTPLREDVPGWIGLLPDEEGTVALITFAEHDAALAPADELGALEGWRVKPDAGLAFPGVTNGYTGPARTFDGTQGLLAQDPTARTLLTRDLTIQALVAWDATAAAGTQTLIARGTGDTAIEYRCWQLRIATPAPGIGRLAWTWQDRGGTTHIQPGGDFYAVDGYLLLTATREWARDRFLLRYWANDTLLAEADTTDMEVGGGVGGRLTLGCAADGAGGFTEHLTGAIDQLAILDVAVPTEQVRHTYRHLAEHQPRADSALRALQPVGRARTRDPASLVQRHQRLRAAALGVAAARAELSREAGLPQSAYGPRLRAWEAITGMQPRAGDTIQIRRARVVAAVQREAGYTTAALGDTLAPILDTDPAAIQFLQASPLWRGGHDWAWTPLGEGTVSVSGHHITLRASPGHAAQPRGPVAYAAAAADQVTLACSLSAQPDVPIRLSAWSTDNRTAALDLTLAAGGQIRADLGPASVSIPTPATVRLTIHGATATARVGDQVLTHDLGAPLNPAWVAFSIPNPVPFAVWITLRDVTVHNPALPLALHEHALTAQAADLAGARAQLAEQKPAHVRATVITHPWLRADHGDAGAGIGPCRFTNTVGAPDAALHTVTMELPLAGLEHDLTPGWRTNTSGALETTIPGAACTIELHGLAGNDLIQQLAVRVHAGDPASPLEVALEHLPAPGAAPARLIAKQTTPSADTLIFPVSVAADASGLVRVRLTATGTGAAIRRADLLTIRARRA